jgi:hypothetical protein
VVVLVGFLVGVIISVGSLVGFVVGVIISVGALVSFFICLMSWLDLPRNILCGDEPTKLSKSPRIFEAATTSSRRHEIRTFLILNQKNATMKVLKLCESEFCNLGPFVKYDKFLPLFPKGNG